MVNTFIGFLGAAFGSVGGVGGGGFFVPMLTLIIGFDQKSSAVISKCKYFHHSFFCFCLLRKPHTHMHFYKSSYDEYMKILPCKLPSHLNALSHVSIWLVSYDHRGSKSDCLVQLKVKASHT